MEINRREELESKIASTYGLDLLKKLKERMNQAQNLRKHIS